jgi:hypothetical protein
VVVRGFPLNRTPEFDTKFVPLTERKPPTGSVPTAVLEGERDEIVGCGFCCGLIVNGTDPETPPPGAGFDTVTLIVAFEATSEEVIGTVSCVLLTKVVVRAFPLNATTEPAMKFVPFTTSTLPGGNVPTVVLEGERDVIAGTGFCWGLLPLTVSVAVCALE